MDTERKAMETLFSLAWMPLVIGCWMASAFRPAPDSARGVKHRAEPVGQRVTFKEKEDPTWEVDDAEDA